MSPKMQGMCIGVKSTFVSVAVYLFCFPLAESSLPRLECFYYIYVFLSWRFYRGTLGTLTDLMSTCMVTSFKSLRH